MAAGDIRAGRAFIEIAAKDAGFNKDLEATRKALEGIGTSAMKVGESFAAAGAKMLALGVGIVTPLVTAAVTFASTGDSLDEMSKRTGVSVEALSRLKAAAEISGASVEDLETSIKRMQKTISEAGAGSGEAAANLAKLGLTAQMLKGLSPDQQFMVIAKRLREIPDAGEKATSAMEIFGRSGTSILPLANDLDTLLVKLTEAGVVMSTEEAAAASKFQESLDFLQKSVMRLRDAVGSALTPTLTEWADKLRVAVTAGIAWVQANKDAALAVLETGLKLIATGAALLLFGKIIIGVTQSIMGIVNVTTVAVKAIAFFAGPVTAVTLAVVALGAGLLALIGVGSKVSTLFSDLEESLDTLKEMKLSVSTTVELDKLKKDLEKVQKVSDEAGGILAPVGRPAPPTPGFERPFRPNTPAQEAALRAGEPPRPPLPQGFEEAFTPAERKPSIKTLRRQLTTAWEVMGTFNVAAASRQGLGGQGSVQDQILTEAEKENAQQALANKLLTDIEKALVKQGGLILRFEGPGV